jgi:hypothetical protein
VIAAGKLVPDGMSRGAIQQDEPACSNPARIWLASAASSEA